MTQVQLKPKTSRSSLRADQAQLVKLIGTRMRASRELCNYSQIKAAKLLGYSNSSKLAKIENGTDTNSVPLWLIDKAAKVYDVSVDYLFGISDDWERDPVVSQQRQVGHWLFEHWEKARAAEVNAIRVLANRLSSVEKAVSHGLRRSLEFKEVVTQFREVNPSFDDEFKLGAKLMRIAIETAEEAAGISAELKRYHAYVELADKSANVNIKNADIFEENEHE